ncbi:MAG TPA: type IV toxin-antitoxin system AbiEi family antitoxin domain-containing protein, partial [Vicinamibacterales bacterium]|nr:type IV toxin-antitoxin system AbiEi family antitoxin domain-containing protein [Vicinamibacterales bacterium]
GMASLRATVLMELLRRCTSVKTVRLCLMLGGELDLPWAKKLDRTQLPTGSQRDWVYRGGDGLLILPPP